MVKNKYLRASSFLISLLCFAAVNCTDVMAGNLAIHKGSQVAFDYTLTVDGNVIDSSKDRGPLQYIQGDGRLIPGLVRQLEGMRPGDEKVIQVSPEEAYGNSDPSAFRQVPLSTLPKGTKTEVGMPLQGTDKNGHVFNARIIAINKKDAVLDLNHPLAGKTLIFKVKIVSVK